MDARFRLRPTVLHGLLILVLAVFWTGCAGKKSASPGRSTPSAPSAKKVEPAKPEPAKNEPEPESEEVDALGEELLAEEEVDSGSSVRALTDLKSASTLAWRCLLIDLKPTVSSEPRFLALVAAAKIPEPLDCSSMHTTTRALTAELGAYPAPGAARDGFFAKLETIHSQLMEQGR